MFQVSTFESLQDFKLFFCHSRSANSEIRLPRRCRAVSRGLPSPHVAASSAPRPSMPVTRLTSPQFLLVTSKLKSCFQSPNVDTFELQMLVLLFRAFNLSNLVLHLKCSTFEKIRARNPASAIWQNAFRGPKAQDPPSRDALLGPGGVSAQPSWACPSFSCAVSWSPFKRACPPR